MTATFIVYFPFFFRIVHKPEIHIAFESQRIFLEINLTLQADRWIPMETISIGRNILGGK